MKPLLTILLLAPLLMGAKPGCFFGTEPETRVVDTFCLTAKKRLWSIDDTAETIQAAEIQNKTIDRKCGVKRKA